MKSNVSLPSHFQLRCLFWSAQAEQDLWLTAAARWGGLWEATALARIESLHRRILLRLERLAAQPADMPLAVNDEPGLAPDRVRLSGYSDRWRLAFEEEAAALQRRLEGLPCAIHHVGSTAVPGLSAKPIVDLALLLRSEVNADDGAVSRRLAQAGYVPLRRQSGGVYLAKATARGTAFAAQLHRADSPAARDLLRFRDHLRSDPRLAAEYGRVKRALADAFPRERRLYLWCKRHWVNGFLARADGGPGWARWLLTQCPPRRFALLRHA